LSSSVSSCLFEEDKAQRGSAEANSEEADDLKGFAAFKTTNIMPRVLDEIVWPMQQLKMKDEEFVCLKVPVFIYL
jgi:hypothetical protein